MKIKHPEWLQLEVDHKILYGYSQNWYKTSFQQTRGCGPTAAAMLLSYMNRREEKHLPYLCHTISSVTEVLEDVWNFVTPGRLLGLNNTQKFCHGVNTLITHYGLNWQCNELSIAAFRYKRVPLSQAMAFLKAGISSDCPVAFLNLHKGKVADLESWHWIVMVSLSYDPEQNCYLATCYDGGRSITFDMELWLETTRFGGGFVYLTAGEKQAGS